MDNTKEVDICIVTWDMNEYVDDLDDILQGASVEAIDRQFVKYVADNIEPTGWQAVWRASKNSFSTLKQKTDFIVDVINVSQVSLDAEVFVKDVVNNYGENKERDNISLQLSVPLIELYPTASQENDSIDIEMTTTVIEHIRFFYSNIWHPWDSFEEQCCYQKALIFNRTQTYYQIKNELIPPSLALEMETLRERGKKAAEEIRTIEATMLAEDSVDQQQVVHLMKLNKEIEQLKSRYDALGDPFLRELSLLHEQMERKDLLELSSSKEEEEANVLVVVSSMLLEDFSANVNILSELLKTLPQKFVVSRVKTFPSLQMALDSAKVGDTIALFSGTHILRHLGLIASGGIICGVGPDVKVVGSSTTGDVLLDLRLTKDERFLLQSVELRPLEFQTAILLHSGQIVIQDCTITGGSIGVCLLSGSRCELKGTAFTNVELKGLQCKGDSQLIVDKTLFEKCPTAVEGDEQSKIIIVGENSATNCCKEICINKAECELTLKEIKNKIFTIKGDKINKEDYDHLRKIPL